MKTAMQKLKSISRNLCEKYHEDITLQWLVDNIDDFIKEEKEQIVEAFELGYKSCDLDEAFEINRKLASGELFYNKTYNQNI